MIVTDDHRRCKGALTIEAQCPVSVFQYQAPQIDFKPQKVIRPYLRVETFRLWSETLVGS